MIFNQPGFFDYVLSPTSSPSPNLIFCKKKKWLPLLPSRFRNWEILNYRCVDYIRQFKKINPNSEKVQVVVLDDMVLLEAFALLKKSGFTFELVFSFHGHSFQFPGPWAGYVDKVLFLTKAGYLETLNLHQEFPPIVSIVGNGVDSEKFYPLSPTEKSQRRSQLGVSVDSKVLIWLSNQRPKKGLHLFQNLADRLLVKYPELEIWIFGSNSDKNFQSQRIKYFGKIPNSDLPKYLQAGDFYAFTSLWKEGFGLSLAEAAKCGNKIIASQIGGIPEVVEGLPGAILVQLPNSIDSWESSFDQAWDELNDYRPRIKLLKNFHDLSKWEMGYLKALQS